MIDLRTEEEYMYFGEGGNGLDSFHDYLKNIPESYSTMKWFKYDNYMFVANTDVNRFFIREFPYKNPKLVPQINEKEVTKQEFLHTLKLLIRKEKISKIKEINSL
jgi:hypothetical protein